MSYKCPKCGGTNLRVEVVVTAILIQEDDGNLQTETAGDHAWDNDSPMLCAACDYSAPASDFDTTV